ncbi:recombinase family protein [Nitrospirillum sp. BR 11163]|uniref:recombinase family protein n=1 Tax=Nitrospirillum sp. BR 11163 TaxID=3104323 RepID=UPI002AFEF274|nr:recombinase family protein [Nitrospirillum sp. BR 11163]MEA1674062.1 recombinase family protein [Nitrospirillum sp. BR 11163]
MRVAIYARYSSDMQDERSIEDQVRLCRDRAATLGQVVEVYADYAISGTSLKTRPAALKMMADAKQGLFDAVVTENLDRISRDQEDTAGMFKRLGHAGVRIISVNEGEITELHVGLKGTMNALYIKDLGNRVRRGQGSRALEGKVPAGLVYGYRLVRNLDARGELVRGEREIDPTHAAIVRRIYETYAAGRSPRMIAAELNAKGIPSPRGGLWVGTTICGARGRASGILHNPLYVGRVIYGRQAFVKNPDTGQREARRVAADKWLEGSAPQLRIIDDALWNAVQTRKATLSSYPPTRRKSTRHLFSGLVRCGCCGGNYVVKTRDYYACSVRKERGPAVCSNDRSVKIRDLESRVLSGIRKGLLDPERIAHAVRTYHEESRHTQSELRRRATDLSKRLAKVDAQITRLVDALADGLMGAAAIGDRLRQLEAEKAAVSGEIAAMEAESNVITLHPAAADAYRQLVNDLLVVLKTDDEARAEAMPMLHRLVHSVEVHPRNGRGEYDLVLRGRLAEMLNLPRRQPGEVLQRAASVGTAKMVAAEGFEPPTKGL